jgi:hypothetical protein
MRLRSVELALVFVALGLGGLAPACKERPEVAAIRAAERRARTATRDDVTADLVRMAAGIPKRTSLAASKCPASVRARAIGYVPVDASYFDLLQTGKLAPPADATEPPSFRGAELASLRTYLAPGAKPTEADLRWVRRMYGQLYGKGVVDRGYLGVVYTDAEQQPVALRDTFKPGRLNGWIVLFDIVAAKPLCEFPFSAESSDEVSKRLVDTTGEVVKKDFRNRVVKALERTLEADGLEIKHYDHDYVL